jgi:hypothetical protein
MYPTDKSEQLLSIHTATLLFLLSLQLITLASLISQVVPPISSGSWNEIV